MTERPNLFDFATTELSQDAFLCWLLSWADYKYATVDTSLHRTAIDFLKSIGKKCNVDILDKALALEIDIHKQYQGIDVLALVLVGERKYALVIEDKIGSTEHSNQLSRYRKVVEKGFPSHKRLLVYLKTGEVLQSAKDEAKKNGFVVYSRADFLEVLKPNAEDTEDTILRDYYQNLLSKDRMYNKFSTDSISEWTNHWQAWEGFFSALQENIQQPSGWEFVNNSGGGEYIFAWHWREIDEIEVSLVIVKKNQGRHFLAFKVGPVSKESGRAQVRNNLYKSLMTQAEKCGWGGVVNRPARFGNGNYMVFGEIANQDDWLATEGDGRLDMTGTIQKLEKAEKLLDFCVDHK